MLRVEALLPVIREASAAGLLVEEEAGNPDEILRQMQNPAQQFSQKQERDVVELYRAMATSGTDASSTSSMG